jgi:hypothetical protein
LWSTGAVFGTYRSEKRRPLPGSLARLATLPRRVRRNLCSAFDFLEQEFSRKNTQKEDKFATVSSTEHDESAFNTAAGLYRSSPLEPNFRKLLETKPPAKLAPVTEVVYEVAVREEFAPPALSNLVVGLLAEGRLQEASHFCAAWLEKEPKDLKALRFACMLACKRADVLSANESLQALVEAGADNGVLWVLKTIMILAFSDGGDALEPAFEMLSAAPRDPIAPLIALDAAFRTKSTRLFVAAIGAAPNLALDEKIRRKFLPIFKRQLADILRSRKNTLETAS